MFTFEIKRFVPKFIMRDKNGYAVAKALEAGLQMMNDIIAQGVELITDVDTMPEWRLDELAWEYNILYDYTQDVNVKREWIREAINASSIYGTPEGLKQYLESAFTSVTISEWSGYSGTPYHFRVTAVGDTSKQTWAEEEIEKAKNLRSVCDGLTIEEE